MKKATIAGMSCNHCVGAVKSALEQLGLTDVSVDLDSGTAAFAPTDAVSEEGLREAIDDIGFEVESVE